MKYKQLIAVVVLALLISACSGGDLALTCDSYKHPPSNYESSSAVPLTLENSIYYSSDIFIGQVVEKVVVMDDFKALFTVEVHETLVSSDKQTKDTVKVYADKLELQVGDRYIFFTSLVSHPVYPWDFYTLRSIPMILKITKGDSVLRLTNPMEQTFITPFQNDEYNRLAPLRAYIKDYRDSVEEHRAGVDELSFVPRAIEKADSWDALFDLAEVVVKVEIHDFHLADKYFGYAYVKVLDQYKDGQLRNESLIVPAHIQPNQIHIMFLTELGVPVTRQGSIYSEDHTEYQDILNWLQKKID